MKKCLTALFLVLCTAFSLMVPVGAVGNETEAQNRAPRITREVKVSTYMDTNKVIAGKTINIKANCTSVVYINDYNNNISYVAPVQMQILSVSMPSGMTVKGSYNPASTDYEVDQYGTAEQRGTLTISVAGRGDWYANFLARISITSNGTVSFTVA